MREKIKYRLRDFRPFIGQEEYLLRNGFRRKNLEDAPSAVQRRYKALFAYNFLTWGCVALGLAKLLQ